MKRVLIALDYRPSAEHVANIGYALGKSLGAEVTLLHVIEDSTYNSILEYPPLKDFMGFTDSEMDHLFDDGPDKAMLLFLEKTKQFLGDDSVKTLLIEGDFAQSIVGCAKELEADIIVLGSHSRGWLKNMVVGNVTEKVLNSTTVPLFIVPTQKIK